MNEKSHDTAHWQSLEELAGSPKFLEFVEQEFPRRRCSIETRSIADSF